MKDGLSGGGDSGPAQTVRAAAPAGDVPGPARAGQGSPRGLVRLIARREIVTRVRERSFAISTLITVLIVVALVVIPHLNNGPDRVVVGVVGSSAAGLDSALEQSAKQQGARFELRRYADLAQARAAVDSGDVGAVFVGADRVIVNDSLDGTLGSVVQAAYRQVASAQRLAAAGIDPARVGQALAVPPLAVDSLTGNSDRQARRNAAFFGIVLLYAQLIGYCLWVALGVVEEKSSRVVELLLATLRPWQLLTGKIIGIGLLGLAQFTVVGAVGVATALISGAVSVPVGLLAVVGQVLVWFVLGYAFYSSAYAAAAALVSRQEELQNITGPLTILLVGSFFIGIFAQNNPGGPVARVASLIPPLSVLTMPVRWAAGDAAWWEIGLSVGLMLIAIFGLVRLAAWIYVGAVLRTGPKVRIREALAAGRRSSR
ncbi:MAG: type transport system permease protein [Mycobacteriales bacterium]|jgi:ABC-2 type transport system permease protein